MSTSAPAQKAATGKVGHAAEVEDGSTVTWPDGNTRVVTGGSVILDQPGTFVIDGREVEAKVDAK